MTGKAIFHRECPRCGGTVTESTSWWSGPSVEYLAWLQTHECTPDVEEEA